MVSATTRKKINRRLNLRGRRAKLTPREREEIAKRYANGESAMDIAKYYGTSLVTVYKWVNKAAEEAEEAEEAIEQ